MQKVVTYKLLDGSGRVCTFDVSKESYNGRYGRTYIGKCRASGKYAYLDDNGVRFDGARRVLASIVPNARNQGQLPYGYGIWGGQIRDMLPHGRRYYMNGGRK